MEFYFLAFLSGAGRRLDFDFVFAGQTAAFNPSF